MTNLTKYYEDNNGIYFSLIKRMLSKDENKLYQYFINNEGHLTSKEQKLLIELLNIKCIDDCKDKIKKTTSDDILKTIIKHKVDDTIIFLKIVFIIVLIVASVINHDTKFITKHTTMFLVESIIFVMLGTLSFFIMTLFRDKSFSLLTYVFVMLFYLMLHILFQTSGMYTGFFSKPSKQEEKTDDNGIIKNVKKVGLYSIIILVVLYSIYVMIIMSYVNDIPEYVIKSKYGYFKFIMEMLLFGILNSIIFYPVAIDRQNIKDPLDNIVKGIKENTFGLSGVLVSIGQMCLLHIVLQYTGFYRSINL
jgi:hypothetical protein